MIIDGGHTPQAALHLREFVGDAESIRLIVGMLRDKNVAAYLSTFDAPNVHLIYTRAPSDRALPPEELLERYRPQAARVTLIDALDEALSGVDQSGRSADRGRRVAADGCRRPRALRLARAGGCRQRRGSRIPFLRARHIDLNWGELCDVSVGAQRAAPILSVGA